jgi:hypothetical protein
MLFWRELARAGNKGQGIEKNQNILSRRGAEDAKGREFLSQGDLQSFQIKSANSIS